MRNFSKVVYVLCAVLALSACDFGFESDVKPEPLPGADFLESVKTCDKQDSEQSFLELSSKNPMSVTGKVETKDFEKTDCEGKVVETGHGPIREFEHVLEIEPFGVFSEDVEYITVENSRTCATVVFDVLKDEALNKSPLSKATSEGFIQLKLTDSDLALNLALNVRNGLNSMQISYFGKCLKPREMSDEDKAKLQENSFVPLKAATCDEAKLLGTKEVLVDVQIERPEVAGTEKISVCKK